MTDQPRDSASLDLPRMPRCLLISETTWGHLYVGHTGDFCWRIDYSDTGAIRRAIVDALAHSSTQHQVNELGYWTDSLDMPKLPQYLVIWEGRNGTLSIGPVGDAGYTIKGEETRAIRQAIAGALKARANHPRPDYPGQSTTPQLCWRDDYSSSENVR